MCNPGGRLAPDEVLGREILIEDLWNCLERQSILLTAERRMGKTSILHVMQARARAGFLPFYRDLEAIRSPVEFTEVVLRDLGGLLGGTGWLEAMGRKFKEVLRRSDVGELAGLELSDFAAGRWKEILHHALTSLTPPEGTRVVLQWDEFPLMIGYIATDHGWTAAAEVLDTLRAARSGEPPLRMLLTGSIGLHHALRQLEDAGYRNRPVNDMRAFDVPPLEPTHGVRLARELLVGEGLEVEGMDAVAYEVSTLVDQVPFFIQHVVSNLRALRRTVNAASVAEVVEEALRNPAAGWDLEQYQSRIGVCYPGEEQASVLAILDLVAEDPRTLAELGHGLRELGRPVEKEVLRRLLVDLQKDHYLTKDREERYVFRLGIVARWWRLTRGS